MGPSGGSTTIVPCYGEASEVGGKRVYQDQSKKSQEFIQIREHCQGAEVSFPERNRAVKVRD